jgi:hypothetical protein
MDDQESFFDGSTPDVDAILTAFPEYAPNTTPGAIRAPGAPQHQPKSEWLKPEDFKGKSQAWREANIHRLRAPSND